MQRSFDDYINEMMRMYRTATEKDMNYVELNKTAFTRAQPAIPPAPEHTPKPAPQKPMNMPMQPVMPPQPPAPEQMPESAPQKPVNMPMQPVMPPQPPAPEQMPEPAPKKQIVTPKQPVMPKYALPPEPEKPSADNMAQDMSGSGKLIVKVTTARGMLPVENADVLISQTEQNGGAEIVRLQTDSSGNTTPISLPAPPKYKSETPMPPNDTEAVMAKYDVAVFAEGYVDAKIKDAVVFDGVTSIQAVDMLTESAANDETGEE